MPKLSKPVQGMIVITVAVLVGLPIFALVGSDKEGFLGLVSYEEPVFGGPESTAEPGPTEEPGEDGDDSIEVTVVPVPDVELDITDETLTPIVTEEPGVTVEAVVPVSTEEPSATEEMIAPESTEEASAPSAPSETEEPMSTEEAGVPVETEEPSMTEDASEMASPEATAVPTETAEAVETEEADVAAEIVPTVTPQPTFPPISVDDIVPATSSDIESQQTTTIYEIKTRRGADINIIFQWFMFFNILLGASFAVRKDFVSHRNMMTFNVLVNWFSIAGRMIPKVGDWVGDPNAPTYSKLAIQIHAVGGATLMLFASYLVFRMWFEKRLPNWIKIDPIKVWMRLTLVIWLSLILLGTFMYFDIHSN